MQQAIFKSVLVCSLVLPLGSIAADLKLHETMSEQVSDAHREMRILTAFNRNPHLRTFDFSVSVDVGTAVLGGTVNDGINKDLAAKIAGDVGGIVVNHILVDPDYMRLQRRE